MSEVLVFTNSNRYKCLEELPSDSVEFSMSYCGWEQCKPGHRFGPNRREMYALHIVLGGKGTLEINGQVFSLKKGDAFLLCPGVEAWYEADLTDPWQYIWMGIEGYKAGKTLEMCGMREKTPVHRVDCAERLKEYMDQILDTPGLEVEAITKRNGYVKLFVAALIESNERLYPSAVQEHTYPGVVYVKHAMEYISRHYREKIKINELADYIGVNRSYLTNTFKKTIGCSPQEYLVNLRMEKAKSMLLNTQKTINVIAEEVGYSDQLAFSKIFKQKCNMSPRAFREQENKVVIYDEKDAFHGRIGKE